MQPQLLCSDECGCRGVGIVKKTSNAARVIKLNHFAWEKEKEKMHNDGEDSEEPQVGKNFRQKQSFFITGIFLLCEQISFGASIDIL